MRYTGPDDYRTRNLFRASAGQIAIRYVGIVPSASLLEVQQVALDQHVEFHDPFRVRHTPTARNLR